MVAIEKQQENIRVGPEQEPTSGVYNVEINEISMHLDIMLENWSNMEKRKICTYKDNTNWITREKEMGEMEKQQKTYVIGLEQEPTSGVYHLEINEISMWLDIKLENW